MNKGEVALLKRTGDVWYYYCPIHQQNRLVSATRTMGLCTDCGSQYLYRPAEVPQEA